MKKSTIIILIIVFCSFVPIIPFSLLGAGFTVNSWFIPNPTKPEITYAEFPFALEYEVDGVYHKYEDVLVCEYNGISYSIGTNKKNRKWTAYYKSGNTQITMFENDIIKIYAFPIKYEGSVTAKILMGDSKLYSNVTVGPDAYYKSNRFKDSDQYRISAYKLLKDYNIRIINWKCAPPIKNTFK